MKTKAFFIIKIKNRKIQMNCVSEAIKFQQNNLNKVYL